MKPSMKPSKLFLFFLFFLAACQVTPQSKHDQLIEYSYRCNGQPSQLLMADINNDSFCYPRMGPFTTLEGRGNEPGWQMEINDNHIFLTMDYGQRQRKLPISETQPSSHGTQLISNDSSETVTLDILDQLCHDTMTGMPYPLTLNIYWPTEILHGCAGESSWLLQGGRWAFTRLGNDGISGKNTAYLIFDKNSFSGSSGCNRFHGQWHLTGERLVLQPAASTRMACSGPLMRRERRLFAFLHSVNAFQFPDHNQLILINADGKKLYAHRH